LLRKSHIARTGTNWNFLWLESDSKAALHAFDNVDIFHFYQNKKKKNDAILMTIIIEMEKQYSHLSLHLKKSCCLGPA
jgi:hypothetical protein